MRTIVALAIVVLAAVPAAAAPCATTGGANALDSASRGLGAGQWCEMSPNVTGATLDQLLTTCIVGQSDWIQNYAASMSYDPGTQTIFFFGTPHGGGYRAIRYSVSTNTWSVGTAPPGSICGGATCTDGPPANGPIPACVGCNASHAYDSNTADAAGNFYYHKFGTGLIYRLSGSTWNTSFAQCPDGGNTGALTFWPEAGSSGSLITVCGTNMDKLWRYDLSSGTWSRISSSTMWNSTYHVQIEYHPGVGQIWLQAGNGSTQQFRLSLNGSTPTLTALGPAPSGRLGMTTSRCAADPASSDTFICWDLSEDQNGTTSAGWYAYDLSDNTWSSFASLGITSMPPLWVQTSDYGSTPLTVAVLPDYGVTVWLTANQENGNGGMFVYKHTAGVATIPPQPTNLRPN